MTADPFQSVDEGLPPEKKTMPVPVPVKYCVQHFTNTGNDKPCWHCKRPMRYWQRRVCNSLVSVVVGTLTE